MGWGEEKTGWEKGKQVGERSKKAPDRLDVGGGRRINQACVYHLWLLT